MLLRKQRFLILFLFFGFFSCNENSAPPKDAIGGSTTTIQTEEKKIIRYNLMARLNDRPELSNLFLGIEGSTLEEKLQYEKGPFTLFATENDALENSLKNGDIPSMVEGPMANGKITTVALTKKIRSNGGTFTMATLSGGSLVAYKKGRDIYIKNIKGEEAKIGKSDITATNGIIHEIDKVLVD